MISIDAELDSLKGHYQNAIEAIQVEHNKEVRQINRVFDKERQEFETDRRFFNRERTISNNAMKGYQKEIRQQKTLKKVVGGGAVALFILGFVLGSK